MSPHSSEPGDVHSPPGLVTVRPMRPDDVAYAVALHLAHLQLGLFPRLGRRFLTVYYRGFVESPYGAGFVAHAGGQPVGFVVGFLSDRDHFAWLLRRRGGRLLTWGILGLLAHPSLLTRFVRTRARRYARGAARLLSSRAGTAAATPATGRATSPVATLAHIVVAPASQRGGAGRLLADAFLHHARTSRCAALRVTAAADDERAERFYISCGWTVEGEATDLDGTRLRRYHRWLNDAPPRGSGEEPSR